MVNTDFLNKFVFDINLIFSTLILLTVIVVLSVILFKALIIWYKNRKREEKSLKFVLLQVAVPRDNEIKIDAAEQMLTALSSVRKGGKFSFLKLQDQY